NLACKFCQNWDISKSRETDTLASRATPADIARAADELDCRSVAFTYNDPTIFWEYAADVADACHDRGIRAIAVTAGYMCPAPRTEFYRHIDAANVDLKAFTEDFYRKVCVGHLADVLDTLVYLRHGTDVWLEITTLLIPGRNDTDEEISAECAWIVDNLGVDVPVHFTAFHPDYKMTDTPPTPPETLARARRIGIAEGLRFVYTGNVYDPDGDTTSCPWCGSAVVIRDWYTIRHYALTDDGRCRGCGFRLTGVYDGPVGHWGRRRLPVYNLS
ncbi:MAG: AmmeMemoRadiSam system radical SAM enzyme, partial [Mycobacterium sp.]